MRNALKDESMMLNFAFSTNKLAWAALGSGVAIAVIIVCLLQFINDSIRKYYMGSNHGTGPRAMVSSNKVEIHVQNSHGKSNLLIGAKLPNTLQLLDTILIKDDEILEYEIVDCISPGAGLQSTYSLKVTDDAKERLEKLEVPVSSGRCFAILVGNQSRVEGYFWHMYSSFSCPKLVILLTRSNKLVIESGFPKPIRVSSSSDPRRDSLLLQAFGETSRLVMKKKRL